MSMPRKTVTADQIRNALDYNPDTGEFRRKCGKYAGQIAGAFCALGYRRIYVCGQTFYAHRLAWLYVHGFMPHELDHANRDRSDNRICNLRVASREQNGANKAVRSMTGHKGVFALKRKKVVRWGAHITIGGRTKALGVFKSAEEAAAAYRRVAIAAYGEFAS